MTERRFLGKAMFFVSSPIPRILWLLGSFIFAFFWPESSSLSSPTVPKQPIATKGTLDLRSWDFQEHGNLQLRGKWRVYWKKLIQPSQIHSHTPDAMLPIPGLWNHLTHKTIRFSSDGFATYHLTLLLKKPQTLSIRINHVYSSYSLFVNRELLWKQGVVGTHPDTAIMRVGPHIISFSAAQKVELLLHISNFSHRKGGPSGLIELGTQEQLLRDRLLRISLDTIVFGMLLLVSLFFFVFNVFTAHHTSSLAFAVACLLVAFRLLIVNEGVLSFTLQRISYATFLRLEYILVYSYVIVAFHFLCVTYPKTFSVRISRYFQFYWATLLVLTLLTSPWFYTRLLWAFTLSSPVVLLYLCYSLVRGWIYREDGIYHLLIGVLTASLGSIYDIWSYSLWGKHTIDFGPIGLLIMAMTQTVFLIQQTRKLSTHQHVPFAPTQTILPLPTPSSSSHPRIVASHPKKTLQGQQIQDWILLRFLGEGGMSVVYEAIHTQSQQKAAIKLIHPFATPNPTRSKRFQREAQMMQRIDHPNVLKVFGSGTDEALGDYMILELLQGQDLQEVMYKYAPLPLTWLSAVVEQIHHGLKSTHEQGIIHRDLKPSNIFLLPTGTFPSVKLLDYGIAKEQNREMTKLTSTGAIIGTPAYLAPEQLSTLTLTPASDIYALGVILFEALTQQLPLQEESMAKLLVTLLQKPATPLGQYRPEFANTPLEALLARMLAKDPQQRPANLDEFWPLWQEACRSVHDPLDTPARYPRITSESQTDDSQSPSPTFDL